MLERDEVDPAPAQIVAEKAARAIAVEEDLRVVVTQREHIRDRLSPDALMDHVERRTLDVEQVESAAKACLEKPELGLGTAPDGQGSQRTIERRRLCQRPQDLGECLADVDLVA